MGRTTSRSGGVCHVDVAVRGVKPRRYLACGVGAILIAAAVEPGVSRVCRVSTNAGVAWSEEVTREVTFVSGAELNRAFDTDRFERRSTYAVLRNGPSEVVVLKLDDRFVASSLRFEPTDFQQLFSATESLSFVQLNREGSSEWRIRARSGRRFFDSRVR